MANLALKNINRLIADSKKELSPEQLFLADLTVAIEKIHQLDQRVPSQSYKHSSMSCLRNMYYQVVGAERDNERTTSELVGILDSGSHRHEAIQAVISQMTSLGMGWEYVDVGTYIEENKLEHLQVVAKKGFETKLLHKTLNISFLCDGILQYKPTGKYYIFEFKTESSSKWLGRNAMDPKHEPQATTYSLCFGINEVIFVYENRDNTAKKSYLYTVQDAHKFDVLGKIEQSDYYVGRMETPPKPRDIPKSVCMYCNYKTICKKAGD